MIEVKLHDVGEGMTEGEIANYLVRVGDRVTIDQPVVEVSTDKMVAELPAPVSGVVTDLIIPVGQTVSVGTV
ncbi:biotin/lipoyl-containing protein, partial [Exiguobacterium artemiae]